MLTRHGRGTPGWAACYRIAACRDGADEQTFHHTSMPVQLAPWKLEADDTKLLDLLPFLEAVVRTAVPDVRAVVKSYEGQDIPTAFKCGP